jgi:hypothetical protein
MLNLLLKLKKKHSLKIKSDCKKDCKKGRSFLLLPFLFMAACTTDPSRHGSISLHSTSDKNSFIFSVNDEFANATSTSPQDEKNPKITKAEAKLLAALLKQKKYCLNKHGTPLFAVTSRQEKIYDRTFAHLIEENYNARPIVPRMYFGQCLEK